MLEINFRPETPAERRAALQLMATLASTDAEAESEPPKAKPWKAAAAPTTADAPNSAPAERTPTQANEPAEFATDDIPWPPSGKSERTYSRSDVVDALQDYARTNGAVALKQVLDQFGARRVSDIKPEHYPEVMTIARGELG